jgi:hypothetical protein
MEGKLKEVTGRMRKDAKDDDYTPDGILGQKLNWYADKIEEIVKEYEASSYGKNLAAMRESLKHMVYWAGECVAGRMSHNDFLVNVQCSAASALRFPARNCDTMDGVDRVLRKFDGEVCDHYDHDPYGPRTRCDGMCKECVAKWMLEKEVEV